ncbi:hypothetical protein MJO28_007152, partial [Puccinia striiformis f. sp. tritici]
MMISLPRKSNMWYGFKNLVVFTCWSMVTKHNDMVMLVPSAHFAWSWNHLILTYFPIFCASKNAWVQSYSWCLITVANVAQHSSLTTRWPAYSRSLFNCQEKPVWVSHQLQTLLDSLEATEQICSSCSIGPVTTNSAWSFTHADVSRVACALRDEFHNSFELGMLILLKWMPVGSQLRPPTSKPVLLPAPHQARPTAPPTPWPNPTP